MPGLSVRTRRRPDRGISALVFALMAPVIIGAVGLSVDGGRLVIERANLQRAADSAALAVGQDCARASLGSGPAALCTNAGAVPTVALATNGNAPGATGATNQTLAAASGSTSVQMSKTVPMTLGAVLGIQPNNLTASATVTWNQAPTAASTLPMSMDICDYNESKSSSTPRLFRYDQDGNDRSSRQQPKTCGSERSVGGALWLAPKGAEHPAFDEEKCALSTDLAFTATYKIQPHNPNFPSGCARNGMLTAGQTYLVIVGESPGWNGWGNGRVPKIRGYAPFVVTGWRLGPKQRVASSGGVVSSCTGSCRGIQGYFTDSVVPMDGATYGTGANFGSIRVKLTS